MYDSIRHDNLARVGYRRMVLELGGNDPLIVMDDVDLEEAASLAAAGSYKNSSLGYKEGVLEAMKSFTNVKSYSLPWPA